MPSFRFETLLQYRSRLVDEHQIALARAQRHLTQEKTRLAQLCADRQRFAEQLRQSLRGMVRVDDVQHQYRYLEALDRLLAEQRETVARAEQAQKSTRTALESVLKDRKTLEKLKEYDEQAFQQAIRAHEAETLDDLNITRYERD